MKLLKFISSRSLKKIHPSSNYPSDATSNQIMEFIQSELAKVINILEQFHVITPEKMIEIQLLIKNYESIDMYSWSSNMISLI